jgi:hypothetical protein
VRDGRALTLDAWSGNPSTLRTLPALDTHLECCTAPRKYFPAEHVRALAGSIISACRTSPHKGNAHYEPG